MLSEVVLGHGPGEALTAQARQRDSGHLANRTWPTGIGPSQRCGEAHL